MAWRLRSQGISNHDIDLVIPESGLILGFPSANERRRYNVTQSLIGKAQT